MICVAMLFSVCKQETKTIKYPEGTLRISCKVYDQDGDLQPYPAARVYFYDFNPFRKEDHLTETMSGFDLATSQLDLGNRYLKYTQMGIADTNGEITMSNVGYGRHWIVGTNIDKNNPSREIGDLIKGLIIDSPENETHFFWPGQ